MTFGEQYSSIYDSLYVDHNFDADVNMIRLAVNLYAGIPNHRFKLFDFGCGTGNHSIRLVENFDVVGIDLSEKMLKIARSKNDLMKFIQGDVKTVDCGQDADVVIMMSAVLGYQHSNVDVLSTLKNVHQHLKPGGLFICDVWHGPAVLLNRPTQKLKSFTIDGSEYVRMVTPELDIDKNLCRCNYKWWIGQNGKIVTNTESHAVRYFFPMEIRFMLETAGFHTLTIGKAGRLFSDLTENDWHMMFVARKS